jgi:hypothetical protein
MNLQVPKNAGKFSRSCTIGSFSRRAQLHEWVNEWVYYNCLSDIVCVLPEIIFSLCSVKEHRADICISEAVWTILSRRQHYKGEFWHFEQDCCDIEQNNYCCYK